jgi:hypothetical protein
MEMNYRQQFGLIKDIDVDELSTWGNRLFLTFDIDWAHDFILADTIDLVERADVAVTWFITHDTPLLERLSANPKFELGIHPNFNPLFEGNVQNGGCAEEVVDRLLEIVPDSKSIRSHSLAQSSMLLNLFESKGLTHESNSLIPEQVGIELKPWFAWNGMIKVPHFWEDDLVLMSEKNNPIQDIRSKPGLKVFDFHPIHVFLNSECMERYEGTRNIHKNSEKLVSHCFEGYGTRSMLMTLLGLDV